MIPSTLSSYLTSSCRTGCLLQEIYMSTPFPRVHPRTKFKHPFVSSYIAEHAISEGTSSREIQTSVRLILPHQPRHFQRVHPCVKFKYPFLSSYLAEYAISEGTPPPTSVHLILEPAFYEGTPSREIQTFVRLILPCQAHHFGGARHG